MSLNRDTLIQRATQRQNLALQPDASVWVSANAGTGKTYVLSRRVMALLMADHDLKPNEILAVTFTKAAAKEMENRIRSIMAKWATLPEEELKADLIKLKPGITAADMARARSLYSLVLDDVSGLSIMTLHSFCSEILAQFPIEAGVAADFKVIDDLEKQDRLAQAQGEVFSPDDADDMAELSFFASQLADQTLSEAFKNFIEKGRKFNRLKSIYHNTDAIIDALAQNLGMERAYTLHEKNAALEAITLSPAGWDKAQQVAQALGYGSDKKQIIAAQMAQAVLDKDLEGVMSIVLVSSRDHLNKQNITKAMREEYGAHIDDVYAELAQELVDIADKQKAVDEYFLTAAYLRIGYRILSAYQRMKEENGWLDFDDIISKAANLLKKDDVADWVRFKMDKRIYHLLLDEGQDIDQEQADIIKAIIHEFFTGEGQHERTRTFFAVGDLKQSIYGFRDARPQAFAQFGRYLDEVAAKTEIVEMETSFRSTTAVLDVVDQVYIQDDHRKAVDERATNITHSAARVEEYGRVEIWPYPEKPEKDEKEPWPLPKHQPEISQSGNNARRVAEKIKQMMNSRVVLSSTGKVVSASDIMILLRSRSKLSDFTAALDSLGIPHTGSDKLVLKDDPAVNDLLALLKFLANRWDSLSLAQVLKSPLFGWKDGYLEELRQSRRSRQTPLWDVLYKAQNPAFTEAKQVLYELLTQADTTSVYQLLVHALYLTNGRGRFLRRFGHGQDSMPLKSVNDGIDALLKEALNHNGGLDKFIHQVETLEMELKRSMEKAEGAVRIMTIHGSKGLQAPIVFLADPEVPMEGSNTGKEMLVWQTDAQGTEEMAYYKRAADKRSRVVENIWNNYVKSLEFESRRLLYVAMTRAQDWLIFAPSGGEEKESDKKQKDSWYTIIKQTAEQNGWARQDDVLYFESGKPLQNANEKTAPPGISPVDINHENWIFAPLQNEAGITNVRATQSATGQQKMAKMFEMRDNQGMRYGQLVHRMLEVLPQYPSDQWPTRAESFLQEAAPDITRQHNSLIQQVLATLTTFSEYFGTNSRPEVNLQALIGSTLYEGAVDRLVVTDNEVLILDYKTGSPEPKGSEKWQKYAEQLGVYHKIAMRIYPHKTVKAGLLWVAAKDETGAFAPYLEWVTGASDTKKQAAPVTQKKEPNAQLDLL